MTSMPESDQAQTPEPAPVADERLLAAEDLARAALAEVTRPETVGPAAGYTVEDEGVVSLRFENRLPGYPGWFWTVSVARVDDAEPTVLEVELLPGAGALLAPDWVPWAVRLAEYQAAQAAAVEAGAADAQDDESDDDLDDALDEDDVDDDLDEDDLDDDLDEDDDLHDASPVLHAGDLDGVDIDELDPEDDSDEDDEELREP
jgi:hypothetical protein